MWNGLSASWSHYEQGRPSVHSGQARQLAGRKTEIKTPMNTATSLPAVKPKLSLDIDSWLLRDKIYDSGVGTTALENA